MYVWLSAAIRNQFFKLIVRIERDSATSTCRNYELYRIRTDRLEAADLGGDAAYDGIKRRLISMLDAKGIAWINSATSECI